MKFYRLGLLTTYACVIPILLWFTANCLGFGVSLSFCSPPVYQTGELSRQSISALSYRSVHKHLQADTYERFSLLLRQPQACHTNTLDITTLSSNALGFPIQCSAFEQALIASHNDSVTKVSFCFRSCVWTISQHDDQSICTRVVYIPYRKQ